MVSYFKFSLRILLGTYFLSKRVLYCYVSGADMESVDVPVFGRVRGRSGMLSRYGISCYIVVFIPLIL